MNLAKFSDCSCDWQMGKKKAKSRAGSKVAPAPRGRRSEDEESDSGDLSGTSSEKQRLFDTRAELREAKQESLRLAGRNAQITLRILIICESYPFLFVSLFLFYICAYSTYSLYSGLILGLTCFLFYPYCYSRCGRLSSYSLSKGRLLSTRSFSSIFHILFFYHRLLLF